MRRIARWSAVVAATLLLAGCPAWPMPGQNPNRTGHNAAEKTITAANVEQLAETWTWTEQMPGPAAVSAPIASAGGIHVTVGCGVVTLNPATGAERWAVPLTEVPENCEAPAGGLMSNPYTVDGSGGAGRSIAASFGYFVPISDRAGNWEYVTRFLDPPTGAGSGSLNSLVSAARGGEYVGLSLHEAVLLESSGMTIREASGNVRSFTVSVSSFSGPSASLGSATITNGPYVLHSGPGALTTDAGPSTQGYGLRAFSKVVTRPGCTVQTGHPTIPTVDLECPLWVNSLDGTFATHAVLSGNGTAFVVTAGGNLYAIDEVTGETRWSVTGAGAAPALANGVLWVPTDDGRILTFDPEGTQTGELTTGGSGQVSNPVVAGDVVYATDNTGSVYAFATAGCASPPCTPLWSDSVSTTWLSSPVVNQGQLYVSTGSALVAYGLP